MTGPDPTPRPQALRIGPGGLPPDQVRPSGPGAPPEWSANLTQTRWLPPSPPIADPFGPPRDPNKWGASAVGGAAVAPPPSRAFVRVVVGLVAFAIVVALGFWANSHNPLTGTGSGVSDIAVGDCLSTEAQRIVGQVDCTSASAHFAVVGVSAESSDASDCSASPSDVVVVADGPTVLCLDYVATVGECLFAGDQSTEVGIVDCGTTDPGVFRVLAILRNSINPADCPAETSQTLVHRYNSQVICLGPS